jgi:hypothetical protein
MFNPVDAEHVTTITGDACAGAVTASKAKVTAVNVHFMALPVARSRGLPLEHREGSDFLDHSRVTWVTPIRRDKLYLPVDKIDV